jgi:hypothetical protein
MLPHATKDEEGMGVWAYGRMSVQANRPHAHTPTRPHTHTFSVAEIIFDNRERGLLWIREVYCARLQVRRLQLNPDHFPFTTW